MQKAGWMYCGYEHVYWGWDAGSSLRMDDALECQWLRWRWRIAQEVALGGEDGMCSKEATDPTDDHLESCLTSVTTLNPCLPLPSLEGPTEGPHADEREMDPENAMG